MKMFVLGLLFYGAIACTLVAGALTKMTQKNSVVNQLSTVVMVVVGVPLTIWVCYEQSKTDAEFARRRNRR